MHFGKFTGCDMEFEMTDEKFYQLEQISPMVPLSVGDILVERSYTQDEDKEVSFSFWLVSDNSDPVRIFLTCIGTSENFTPSSIVGKKFYFFRSRNKTYQSKIDLRKLC